MAGGDLSGDLGLGIASAAAVGSSDSHLPATEKDSKKRNRPRNQADPGEASGDRSGDDLMSDGVVAEQRSAHLVDDLA